MQNQNSDSKIRKFRIDLLFKAAAGVLVATSIPAHAQRHDDAVKSREYRGSASFNFKEDAKNATLPADSSLKSLSIFKNVTMASTSDPFFGNPIHFGPFTNISNYTLTITLTYMRGGRGPEVSAVVDGVHVIGGSLAASTFVVPPGKEYRFAARAQHSISASALVPGAITELLPQSVGLPSAEDFTKPWANEGYLGCETKPDRDPQTIHYYRTRARNKDKSTAHWHTFTTPSASWGWAYAGDPAPGPCIQLASDPPPPPSPPSDGL